MVSSISVHIERPLQSSIGLIAIHCLGPCGRRKALGGPRRREHIEGYPTFASHARKVEANILRIFTQATPARTRVLGNIGLIAFHYLCAFATDKGTLLVTARNARSMISKISVRTERPLPSGGLMNIHVVQSNLRGTRSKAARNRSRSPPSPHSCAYAAPCGGRIGACVAAFVAHPAWRWRR